ncbi:hypothetical protein SAMN03080598_00875 [Algoriphagus boritolerans DSM 17298 = JCM 18970]|uniref:CNNM transmembrane domain-containing protein n=3 Tax=Algoriphagus TaxID=246875 RepID=A0A1H5TPS4_9BACT|nr:hypothetical protein SAMN03080598_00875 [Algoriphagus boritolerans DSM 17298 = JCM 18970]
MMFVGSSALLILTELLPNLMKLLIFHTYDSETAKEIHIDIRAEYIFLFAFLQKKLEEERMGKTGNLFDQ